MKLFISVMASIAMLGSANAASILQNCAAAKSAGFFANDLESTAQEGKTPVLLFNDKDEVVGLLTVAPERAKADPHDAKKVVIKKIAMCASFEVTNFYYADGSAENLLEWTSAKAGTVYVGQDEGQIAITAKVGKKESYATRIEVDFKAYDVMTEIESYTPAQRKSPEFIEDWGLPKGVGSFHLFVPSNWKIVPQSLRRYAGGGHLGLGKPTFA